jgi:thiol-disulfide isomerase/thioredoxin
MGTAYAQIKVYDFEAFEPLIHQENDTTYVLNFWATWCLPCVKELPAFERLNQENKNKKFKMILVSLDFGRDVLKRLLDYKLNQKLSAEIVLLDDPDANAWIPKIDKDWSGAIPATIIYRNEKWQFYGHSFTYEELKNEIENFIN